VRAAPPASARLLRRLHRRLLRRLHRRPDRASPPPRLVSARLLARRRGNDIAFPYSYDWHAELGPGKLTLYQEYSAEMAIHNGYAAGRPWESVGYTTNGEADDWAWGQEHILSLTLEVGNSRDSFWPPPSRIMPIANDSLWPARYMAAAAGSQLHLHKVSVEPAPGSETSGSLTATVQNNGLAGFERALSVCVRSTSTQVQVRDSAGWAVNKLGTWCGEVGALASRAEHALPKIQLEWQPTVRWVELEYAFETETAGVKEVYHFRLKVLNARSTLHGCDDNCLCEQADPDVVEYSHECLQRFEPAIS
jgi:hypothetical protein